MVYWTVKCYHFRNYCYSYYSSCSRMALLQSIQTVHFVQEWHKDSDVLCSTQRQIDGKLAAQMADLQQVVQLGDQVNTLQKQIRLKCDWNITSFCVTPHKYNELSFHWDRVKQHLLNQGNLSLGINNLQQEIMDTFSQKIHLFPSRSNLLEAAADGISQLNPIPHLKTIGGSMAGFMLIFICLFFCFYIVWQQIKKTVNGQQQQLATIALASVINNNHKKPLKIKKGGYVENMLCTGLYYN